MDRVTLPALQVKLPVLQEAPMRPVGATRRGSTLRIVSATHRDLEAAPRDSSARISTTAS